MLFVIGDQNSVANQFMLDLRDKERQKDRSRFRHNLERLGEIMAYEISRHLRYVPREVNTPLGKSTLAVLENQPVLMTILRAGLPYYSGFQNFFEQADSGFVGAYRKETQTSLEIKVDYFATPSLAGKDVILIDPMLASGRSAIDTLNELVKRGMPRKIYFASLVASPQGIEYVQQNSSVPYDIFAFSVDEKLNDQFYIVPGLGDAGDLSFGERMV
jgi:uracil phosphoribosyltransferase